MERWNANKGKNAENIKVDQFLNEVIEVSKKHGFSISHEDNHGGFIIRPQNQEDYEWLLEATDSTDEPEES